jgi:putative Holliday junction resolvase
MRFLALDLGEKRTGLALGDDLTRIATPLGTIESSDPVERLDQIGRAIERHGAGAVVVGLPLNMDGTEGEAARRARSLAEAIGSRFGLPVHLVDERLSSHAAQSLMRQTEMTRRKRKLRIDALAAATILNDFLSTRGT